MQVTEEDLKEFFSPSSRVKEVRILRERGTARPRVSLLQIRLSNSRFYSQIHHAKRLKIDLVTKGA